MDEVAEEMTPEQEAEFRKEVIAELAAEESGEPIETPVDKPAEKPKEAEEEVDPWAGVNPALKAQFDDMSARVQDLDTTETRLKQAESRIGAITNELHAAKQEVKEAQKAPTEEEIAAAAGSKEQWEILKEDNPEWAEALEYRLAEFEKNKPPVGINEETLKAELAALRTSLEGKTAAVVERAVLSYAHPGWEKTIKSKDYTTWLQGQSTDVIAKTRSVRSADAIEVLDRFVESNGQKKSAQQIARERRERLQTSVVTAGRKATAPKSEEDMTEAELRSKIGKEVFAEINN